MDSKRKNQKSKRGGSAASGKFADEAASNERAGDGGGLFVGKMHISYSREDSELLVKVQDAAQKAMWQITGIMSNQGKDWFAAWRTLLEKAGGVCILFTEANPKVLNNSGVGYKEKLSSRFKDQGNKSALYLEAMAIMEVKAQRPEFKIYIVDGINHTAEHSWPLT